MNPTQRILRNLLLPAAAVLGVALTGTGCTHYANMTEVDAPDDVPTYVSSRSWRDGTPRTVVTERVLETGGRCDLLEVRRDLYAPDGLLSQRVVELQRCGVVEHSTLDDYDFATATQVRVTRWDDDRDGRFDSEEVQERSVSLTHLAQLSAVAQ